MAETAPRLPEPLTMPELVVALPLVLLAWGPAMQKASAVGRLSFVRCVVGGGVTVGAGTTGALELVTIPLISPLPESWAFGEGVKRTMAVRSTSSPENTRMLEVPRYSVGCF